MIVKTANESRTGQRYKQEVRASVRSEWLVGIKRASSASTAGCHRVILSKGVDEVEADHRMRDINSQAAVIMSSRKSIEQNQDRRPVVGLLILESDVAGSGPHVRTAQQGVAAVFNEEDALLRAMTSRRK
jgi:hypothetical protein